MAIGRPKKKERRGQLIGVLFTPSEELRINEYAKQKNLTVSTMLQCIVLGLEKPVPSLSDLSLDDTAVLFGEKMEGEG